MKLRKVFVSLAVVALPVTVLALPGAASAKGAPVDQAGTVSCAKITGTITFDPPLTLAGGSTENTEIKITAKSCKVTGGTVTPKKGSVSQDISAAGSTNACTSLENSQAEKLTVKWAPAKKIAPTTASFSGYAVSSNGAGDEGFTLPNSNGTGSAVGSYAQASGVTAAAYSNETSSQLSSACASPGGLKTLKITSGTLN